MLLKIISGGQTGADRAALDAGIALNFPIGGYCPAGRMAEDGAIGAEYPLIEIEGGYRQRTKRNVEDSNGTVIFYDGDLHGGTEQTLVFCIKTGRPYKLIDISLVEVDAAAKAIITFIETHNIGILNVAGPRLSRCAAIYDYVKGVVCSVITEMAS